MKKFVISMLAVLALASSVNAGVNLAAIESSTGQPIEVVKKVFAESSSKALKKISNKDQATMMNSGAHQQLEALLYLIDTLDKRFPGNDLKVRTAQFIENAYGVNKDLDEAEYAYAFEKFTTLQVQDICNELTWRLYKFFEVE
ncbi:hypothetical protein [uncultured Campylobacter sp.]|uniref:hypothetical protein n=1 Tax=uncultured Campylobacter sp. TaxID=218934 RepID=UPI0025DED366|nr:hypothetical protein [uncultured Campylobacter sp.]